MTKNELIEQLKFYLGEESGNFLAIGDEDRGGQKANANLLDILHCKECLEFASFSDHLFHKNAYKLRNEITGEK